MSLTLAVAVLAAFTFGKDRGSGREGGHQGIDEYLYAKGL